jgi:D-xylose transport system substrate-binding protein
MKKIAAYVFISAVVIIGLVYLAMKFLVPPSAPTQGLNPNSSIRIGFLLGDLREERWQHDRDYFVAAAQKKGAYVQVMSANSDAELQNTQVENLISQGINVLVIAPWDAEKMSAVLADAHKANIKIISYDRLILNSDVDFYVTFDNEKVGRLEAQGVTTVKNSGNFAYIGGAPTDNNSKLLKQGSMEVLNPLIKSGSVKLVVDTLTEGWKPDVAYGTIKNYLAGGGKLDAVVAANDGTAGGVIRALKEFNLAGKVPVSGQDAELAACQAVVAGTQTLTVYKPIPELAEKAAEIAITMAQGQTPTSNSNLNNGKMDVPSYFLDPILVTKENMDTTVIKDGFQTRAQVYQSATNK